MTATPQFGPDYIRAIAPYIAGKPISEVAREFGLDSEKIIKLASNENPLGIPPSARKAMEKEFAELGRYPDSNGFEFKRAITAKYGVGDDWVTIGNGSNDVLDIAARAFVRTGESIVFSEYCFAVYPLAAQSIGAIAKQVPALNYGHDLDGMLVAIDATTKLVFVANPNNPTGSWVSAEALLAFLDKVPPHVVVVLDEAYTDYLPPELRYDSIPWARRYPNLIVSRTMSKAYGLAGLRIGFAIANPVLTDLMNRVRQPFNVNSLAQAAAVAALADDAFLQKSYELNRAGYLQLTQAFERLGLFYVPSAGNFVLVKVGEDEQAGARVNLALLKQGVIVRPVGNYKLPRFLRISIGLPEENAACIAALEKALA
ncbi:MAG: histidinol-phosphate transaminase [Candidatus Protistobacter heckmanni]|nr:histidinol-phosphate transaminase [Candidatus Protistobacter heckmanni]